MSPSSTTASGRILRVLIIPGWICLALSGCDLAHGPAPGNVRIHELSIHRSPWSVLSAGVTVRSGGARLVKVRALSAGGHVVSTPAMPVRPESTVVPLICLEPSTEYVVTVIVESENGTADSAETHLTTDALPPDLPPVTLAASDGASPGYILIGMTSSLPSPRCYALALDNNGDIVWYRGFDAPVTDVQRLPNGNISAYSSPDGNSPRFLELDLLGNVIAEYAALPPETTGPHELRVSAQGHLLFGVEFRTMDLSAIGGMATASVRGISVQGFTGGVRDFSWSTFDHFRVDDAAADVLLTTDIVNPWHGNAIDIDHDGNLLVSFRNMDEITRIDRRTGEVLWRMGGKRGSFTFVGDPLNGFSHQHGIRRLANGHIILFDNGNLHDPPLSRAVEYAVDEMSRTATLMWEYRGRPDLYSSALGFAQRLNNGNTLICFGLAQHIVEVTPSGRTTWEAAVGAEQYYPYRAFRVASLYVDTEEDGRTASVGGALPPRPRVRR